MEAKTIQIDWKQGMVVNVYFLGDVHEGAANMNEKAFKEAVKLIKDDGDYWLGLGDYVDAINYHDKRFNPHEISERYNIRDLDDLPKRQSDKFIENVDCIKDKCLGLLYGNHEDTYRQYNTFDVVDYMTKQLSVSNLKHKAWISLSFLRKSTTNKGTPIKIVACHGQGGGGMREGFPINKCHDVFRWDMADVHIMGHLHRMAANRATYNRYEHNCLRKDPIWFAVNGCFLEKSTPGNDGYFEQKSGQESSIGLIKLIIRTGSDREYFNLDLQTIYL